MKAPVPTLEHTPKSLPIFDVNWRPQLPKWSQSVPKGPPKLPKSLPKDLLNRPRNRTGARTDLQNLIVGEMLLKHSKYHGSRALKKTCLSKGTGSALKGNRLGKNSRTYVQISICLGKASKKSPKPSTKVTKILPNGAKRLLNGATWTHQELPKGSSGTQLGPLGYPGGPHGPHRGHREPPRSPMGSTGDPKVTHLASF